MAEGQHSQEKIDPPNKPGRIGEIVTLLESGLVILIRPDPGMADIGGTTAPVAPSIRRTNLWGTSGHDAESSDLSRSDL